MADSPQARTGPSQPHAPRSRWRRRVLLGAALPALIVIGYGVLLLAANESSGASATGDRLARMERSPQWHQGTFRNGLPRVDGPFLEMTTKWITGGSPDRAPHAPVEIVKRKGAEFPDRPAAGLAVTWLGHSTLLVDIDGYRVLIDPVWGERASPFSFLGPARFYDPPLPLDELPRVDAVVISHDHYDHLDTPTVVALRERDLTWAVPLGVGAHLVSWGVPEANIVELDWWEETRVGELTSTATPARHFSGRSVAFLDQDRTLWAGWAITTSAHRVFYSGDTALFDGFIEIGQRLGPFHLTMFEVGAYDRMWSDVHLGPEQAVRAHRLVAGDVFLPVHWGLFDLALHGWAEPIERVLVAAAREGVHVVAPRPGETVALPAAGTVARWWPSLPFEPVSVHDARSSGVDALLGDTLPEGVRTVAAIAEPSRPPEVADAPAAAGTR